MTLRMCKECIRSCVMMKPFQGLIETFEAHGSHPI